MIISRNTRFSMCVWGNYRSLLIAVAVLCGASVAQAMPSISGTANYGCQAKCHYLRMYTDGSTADNPDGTLARDYVPAVLEGVAGMFDRLDGSFTPSAGSGAFKYGSVTNTVGFVNAVFRSSEARQVSGGGLIIFFR